MKFSEFFSGTNYMVLVLDFWMPCPHASPLKLCLLLEIKVVGQAVCLWGYNIITANARLSVHLDTQKKDSKL